MFPGALPAAPEPPGFPRVCGDVSDTFSGSVCVIKLSPRMRGCFSDPFCHWRVWYAFPAYAGMFLCGGPLGTLWLRFPRVCGDVSVKRYKITGVKGLSPRMRGCFRNIRAPSIISGAFPAYAGMFPVSGDTPMHVRGFLQLRERDDLDIGHPDARAGLSPRMRGCFSREDSPRRAKPAFPAYAGMFPMSERSNSLSK